MKKNSRFIATTLIVVISWWYLVSYAQKNDHTPRFDQELALVHIKQLEDSLIASKQKVQELDSEFYNDTNYYENTRPIINALITEMEITIQELTNAIQTNKDYELQIEKLNESIKEIMRQKELAKEKVEEFTKLLYQIHNEMYNGNVIDELNIFLKWEKTFDIISQELYLKILIEDLQNIMKISESNQLEQDNKLEKAYNDKRELEKKMETYQSRIEDLDQKQAYLEDFIKLYKENKVKRDKKQQDLFKTRNDIQNQINQLTQEIINNDFAPAERDRRKTREDFNKLKPRGAKENFTMSRPVLPINAIQRYFNDEEFKKEFWTDHQSIHIKTTLWTPIHAPLDWVVVKSVDNQGLGINRIVIAHKNKMVTTYLYLRGNIVHEGEIIRQWEVIGFSNGNEGDNIRSSSKAAGLEFGISKDGKRQDPLEILDLSTIQNKEIIPEVLQIKYIRDKEKMDIDLTNVVFIEGDTIQERRIKFLKTYAQGIYRSPTIWEEAWQDHNIDPIFVSCIVMAESSWGKNLASDNNPGNIGNPDDPNIRTNFNSPIDGIKAIYDTLDNKFLRNRNTIDELSGFGENNKWSKLYATSPFNRQNNIQRCLSSIYGYYVPQNRPFRTGPVEQITKSFQATPYVDYNTKNQ